MHLDLVHVRRACADSPALHRRTAPGVGVLALAAILCRGGPATAQAVLGPEIDLIGAPATSLGRGGVIISQAADGRILAVWSDDRTGDHDVYGALIDAAGTPLTPVGGFRIVGSTGTHEGNPRIGVCGNTFLVVWCNGYNDDAGNASDIFATRVSSTGVVLDASPIVLANDPGLVEHNPRYFASDGVDTFLVPYRAGNPGAGAGVRFMRVSASTGLPLDAPGGIALTPATPGILRKNPSSAFGAGMFLLTWDDAEDGCTYPGESGCTNIHGALIDPATGGQLGTQFPTTVAFSCQEGSYAVFDGTNFFVAHSDERFTNCTTADVFAERVTTAGVVLDPVTGNGLVGGIAVATDPVGHPGLIQTGPMMVIDDCGLLLTYRDEAGTSPDDAIRVRRLDGTGASRDGLAPSDFGLLVGQGSPSPGVHLRAMPVLLAPNTYLLAYDFGNVPKLRTVTFASCATSGGAASASKVVGLPRAASDLFGSAADIDGQHAIVGAPKRDEAQAVDCGAAFLFRRTSLGAWSAAGKLIAKDAARSAGDEFGRAVAIAGNLAAVGAPMDDIGAPDTGSVYVFRRLPNGSWTQERELSTTDTDMRHYGAAVALDGSTLIVGAPGSAPGAIMPGTAFVWVRSPSGTWIKQARLQAPAGAGVQYGASVAISGNTAIVGAPRATGGSADSGAAYVFVRNGAGQWTLAAALKSADGAPGDRFGAAVGLWGASAVVGAPRDDTPLGDAGSVHVFRRGPNGQWASEGTLRAPDAQAGDAFGGAVSLTGTHLLVGAAGDDDAGESSGSAHQFVRTAAGEWKWTAKVVANDARPADGFGGCVAAAADATLVGAPGDDSPLPDAGAAYFAVTGVDDCNGNGVPDAQDIAQGWSADANHDLVPDECQTAGPIPAPIADDDGVHPALDPGRSADLDGDGAVGPLDLALLLAAWGTDGPADLDRSGLVDADDLRRLVEAMALD